MARRDVRKPSGADDLIPAADALHAALDVAVAAAPSKLVLAVSGGRDSMALLHAMARWAPHSIAAVATYDHGSGGAATDAAALVAAEGRRLGLTVIRERARSVAPTEEAWRAARWSFLKRVARGYRASVATAHTRDDQVETVVMRLLRGAGARGLAALAAPSSIVRPWLPVTRSEVADWAAVEKVPFVDDPSNYTRRYFRSRVRLDLLPALERVHPGFSEDMLELGDRAARLRQRVEALIGDFEISAAPDGAPPGAIMFPVAALAGIADAGLAVLWPALMARSGVALNRRGTGALVRFTARSRTGHALELAGKSSVVRVRIGDTEFFELRPGSDPRSALRAGWKRSAPALVSPSSAALPRRFGQWRFTPVTDMQQEDAEHWLMPFPDGVRCDVRAFRSGDRIITAGAPAGRRVARYLSEAHVPAVDRPHWPVVLIGEHIVWVPGVCRSLAAPNRPGRPAVTWYRCEREHG